MKENFNYTKTCVRDKEGKTVLWHLFEMPTVSATEVARCLCIGADVTAIDNRGDTVRDYLKKNRPEALPILAKGIELYVKQKLYSEYKRIGVFVCGQALNPPAPVYVTTQEISKWGRGRSRKDRTRG